MHCLLHAVTSTPSSWSSSQDLLSPGIAGMCHRAWLVLRSGFPRSFSGLTRLKSQTHFLLCCFFLADMRRDVQEIFRMTPHEKQVMMFSATLSKEIRPVCRKFMQDVNTLLPSLPPLPARCLLPLLALFLQTPLSFKHQEGSLCPSGSSDSLKKTQRQRQLAIGSARARETPEDLVGLT